MKICYARVSTGEQNPRMQIDALDDAGCEKVFTDQVSGARAWGRVGGRKEKLNFDQVAKNQPQHNTTI